MRTFYSLLAFAAISAGICPASENLLKNGGFESGTAPWSASEWTRPKMGKFTFKQTQDQVYAGKYAGELAYVSGGSNIVLGQHITVSGRQNLILNFYAKADVRVSTSTQISASIVTVDKNNKKLQYELKRFTVSDNWEKFSWRFATAENTARMTVYLRCGKDRIWFDNVELKKFQGVNMIALQTFYPTREVIPTLIPSDAKGQSEVTAVIRDASGKNILFKNKIVLNPGNNFPQLKVPGIKAGQWILEVTDQIGSTTSGKFVWPAENPSVTGKRNNFVTVLYPQNATAVKPGVPIKFTNPREGWLYLKLRAESDSVLALPGSSGQDIRLKAGESTEIMRLAPAGNMELKAVSGSVKLAECEIRTMAELIFCEYEGMQSRSMYFGLMKGLPGQTMLKNTNIIMEGFDGAYTLGTETIPESTAKRIAAYRASGKQVISHTNRTTRKGTRVPLEKTPEFWSTRIGMTQFDGTAIDEFAHETPEELKHYCAALEAINQNSALKGKRIYAYSCAAWDTHGKSVKFRELIAQSGGIYAPEFYLREKKSLGEAKSYINGMLDYLRHWPKSLPESMGNLVIVLSCTDGLPSYYGQDTFANTMYKYFLDLQYQILATDPQFKDLRGLTAWILRYSKPETIVWLAMLNRHYCIEGNTELLSDRLGYKFELPYVKNPDFVDGLKDWQIAAAAPGSISVAQVAGWGFGRGTCNTGSDGDTVVLLKRVPGKVNVISQKLTGLKPGQWYELSCRVADYDDVTSGKRIRKLLPLKMTVAGHKFATEISAIDTYLSAHPMQPHYKTYPNGPAGNEQRLFFKAKSPTVELIISDDGVTPDIKAGNYISAPHAVPAKEDVKKMMINFIQLQPVLPPDLWYGAIK